MRVVKPAWESPQVSLLVEVCPAYDLVISLAAAAHPDRYEVAQSWARTVRGFLPAACARDLSFFFGDPLSLGLGAIQLIPELPDAQPESLLRRLHDIDAADFVAALLTRGTEGEDLTAALRRLAHGIQLRPDEEALVRTHL